MDVLNMVDSSSDESLDEKLYFRRRKVYRPRINAENF